MPARVNPDVPGEPRLLRRVGKRIRDLREKRGLTMAQLGASARGVVYFQRQYVWKMETGRVAPSFALDGSIGVRLFKASKHPLTLQVDGRNLTDERPAVAESELGDAQYYRLPARRVDVAFTVRLGR